LLGPAREELAQGLRAHFFRNYVIYYIPTDRKIVIVRVVHGARDRLALFTDE
jgi:plasmid stabilization system protein ParE